MTKFNDALKTLKGVRTPKRASVDGRPNCTVDGIVMRVQVCRVDFETIMKRLKQVKA